MISSTPPTRRTNHSYQCVCTLFYLSIMSFSSVPVDSVFGKSPEICTKRDLCMFLQRHRTIAGDLALPTTGTKPILIER